MNKQHQRIKKSVNKSRQRQVKNAPSSDNFYALQRAIKEPSKETLTPDTILQLQRTIGNQAVQNLLNAQNASALQSAIQMSRSYTGAEGDGSSGGGNTYKIIQYGGYHIKFHPRTGGKDLFFDEFHVTFESEAIRAGEPKIYFDTDGNRITSYDGTNVNRAYIRSRGKNAFGNLITAAKKYAKAFLDNCNKNGVTELSSEDEGRITEEYETEERRKKALKDEEDERLGEERRKRDERHSTDLAEDPRSLFGNQSNQSKGQEIFDRLGIVKGMKAGELAPWIYVPLRGKLDDNDIEGAQVQINRIEDNTLKQKLQGAIA